MTTDMQRTLIAGLLVGALLALAIALLTIGLLTNSLALVMSGVSTIIGGLLTALNTPSASRPADPTLQPGTVITTADPSVPTTTTTETKP